MINFGRSALFSKMTFFTVIIAFSFFFWSRVSFLRFLLEASFSFSECRIGFPIYLVGVALWLSLEISILVVSLIFLGSFSEIVVEARNYRDQIFPICREFLNNYSIFNSLGQALVKLRYLNSFVLCHF
jgi:hypothetical protein